MIKTAYFDCSSGISGDMIIGALIDCGLKIELLKRELSLLPIDGYELGVSDVKRNGIRCKYLTVNINDKKKRRCNTYKYIADMLEKSNLSDRVKQISIQIFSKIASAEANVHGTDIDKVHFHEVGAVDSIIDIVGSAIGFSYLGIDSFVSSPVNVGNGAVNCSHGTLPVPAPATAELLKGTVFYSSNTMMELATPTGVGILTTMTNSFGEFPLMKLEVVGYGAGSHEIKGRSNILRLFIGRDQQKTDREEVYVIETNIDDMNPQFYAPVMDKLFANGALDVFLTPIIMKKCRPAVKITVLSTLEKEKELSDVLLKNTSTFGLRCYKADRKVLTREIIEIKTKFGTLKAKKGSVDGVTLKIAPEYEECKKNAEERGIPIHYVYEEIEKRKEETV